MKASELNFINAEGGVDEDLKCNSCQKPLPIATPLRYADVVVTPNQTATVIVCSRTCQRYFVRNGDQWLDDFITELKTKEANDISGPKEYALNQAKAALENIEIGGIKLNLGEPIERQRCYWNGEYAAHFAVVEYKILEHTQAPAWWCNALVGQIRQGLILFYGDMEPCLIDNQHGDAYLKVTRGMGSPGYSHKSVNTYEIVNYLKVDQVNKTFDVYAIEQENADHRQWLIINNPVAYEKMIALEEAYENVKTKFKR